MKTIIFTLLFGVATLGAEPSIIFDNRPEFGIPPEAKAQENLAAHGNGTLSNLLGNTVKTVRVRYFNQKTWPVENQARDYIAGLLTNKSTECYTFQIWSELVAEPGIECLIDFTDETRGKVVAAHKQYYEGRLLIWNTEACYRDPYGKWWYIELFDYFHGHHPSGTRDLSREKMGK